MGQTNPKQTAGYSEYQALLNAFVSLVLGALGDQLVSVVLYGSVALGTARPDSDVDVLLILGEVSSGYWKRLQSLLPIPRQLRKGSAWGRLEERGMTPSLNLLVLSSEEAEGKTKKRKGNDKSSLFPWEVSK